ncbi:hypothetical protein [Izhakiella australiensis]|nr:hypothetical protein [Izhakiella australiensis]
MKAIGGAKCADDKGADGKMREKITSLSLHVAFASAFLQPATTS